ncbi:hypothetical protein LCGC14_1484640 [marine sediment metagenome]|uniref:Zona occludens toxin N-terminal domain-containing protein n=1 Tax=marine sediment metagenome TaxID=412755 RepID=A0A0F9LNZ4_9ZZZZ
MVEFYDPLTKENISYHIDKNLIKNWDKLREGILIKKDDDKVYIVDGRERGGKSTFAIQQAKYLDSSFNIDRVCFTAEQFLYQIRNAPKGSCIVFDEAFRGLSSKASQSKINKSIVEGMMEMGQRNLIIFIVLPTFFLLEIYAAVLRSNTLFHIYKDPKSGIRKFRIYNFKEKSILYRVGKKKGFDYSYPRVRIRGSFFKPFPIDKKSYDKKKLDTFKGVKEKEEESDKRLIEERNFALIQLNESGWSYSKIQKKAKEVELHFSNGRLSDIIGKHSKKKENFTIQPSI